MMMDYCIREERKDIDQWLLMGRNWQWKNNCISAVEKMQPVLICKYLNSNNTVLADYNWFQAITLTLGGLYCCGIVAASQTGIASSEARSWWLMTIIIGSLLVTRSRYLDSRSTLDFSVLKIDDANQDQSVASVPHCVFLCARVLPSPVTRIGFASARRRQLARRTPPSSSRRKAARLIHWRRDYTYSMY